MQINAFLGTDQIGGIKVPIGIVPQQLSKAELLLNIYNF